jgi:hypothetical protein
MAGRFDTAEELATLTTRRVLEQLAGRAATGVVPWTDDQDVVVFNASPHPRSGVVRLVLDAYPPWRVSIDRFDLHPLAMPSADPGFTVDGAAVRVVATDDPARVQFLPGPPPLDLEFVAADVPAFGCRRYRLRAAPLAHDLVDDGREVTNGDIVVRAADDGTLGVQFGDTSYSGLFGLEDRGDRGDSYDFDPVDDGAALDTVATTVRRVRHPGGIERLVVERKLRVPAGLDDDRERRSAERLVCSFVLEALVAPDVPFVEVTVTFDNRARDHRFRVCFPTGAPVTSFSRATTCDVATDTTTLRDATSWVHPAPATFVHQGWVAANGLVVGAPGLPEAEVRPDGTIAITLVRSVGWLSRFDVRTRPVPAGPEMRAAGAQVLGPVVATFALGRDAVDMRDAELGLQAVLGGPDPRLADGASLLAIEPRAVWLSGCKAAEDGDGVIVRLLNPTGEAHDAVLTAGFDLRDAAPVRLDECGDTSSADGSYAVEDREIRLVVPPHALRSVRVRPA